jgi:hypothetical protein
LFSIIYLAILKLERRKMESRKRAANPLTDCPQFSACAIPAVERGGRAKRFFSMTPRGIAAVNRTRRALRSMTEGLDPVGSYS